MAVELRGDPLDSVEPGVRAGGYGAPPLVTGFSASKG